MYRLLAFGLILVSTLSFAQTAVEKPVPASTVNVLTRQNDNQHTGQNLQETILTPANVNSTTFGKVFSYPVDGQIYAQPLYVQGVTIGGVVHNVVYIATENDSVYAFDADSAKSNTKPLWHTSFLTPPTVLPIPCNVGAGICQLYPVVGITATPVINLNTNTIYVNVRTQETGTDGTITYFARVHALSITTGGERTGSPVVICSGTNNQSCGLGTAGSFQPAHQQSRPGMLLVPETGFAQGVLFMAFAGNSGWVVAYNAQTLQFLAAFFTDDGKPHSIPGLPGKGHSGMWGGITADTSGNVYAVSGDGFYDGIVNWGDSLVKLTLTQNADKSYSLLPADWFTPTDQTCRWQLSYDLGSAGPLIIPSQGGATPNMIFQSGKATTLCDPTPQTYIVNRDNMGHLGGQIGFSTTADGGTEASAAYWSNGTTNYIYNGGADDALRAYTVSSAGVSATDVMHTSFSFAGGTTPVISANGATNGIVWGLDFQGSPDLLPGSTPLVLHAVNANNMTELYNSTQAVSGRDRSGPFVKYQAPMVANGKVYVGTQNELDVYGLCPCPQ